METKLFVAAKAFIVDKNEVLVIRESCKYKTGTQIGKYDLPGGRIKEDEPILEALKRETQEETGLNIEIEKSFSFNESWPEFKKEKWHIIRIIFLCKLVGKRSELRLGNDHDDHKWINPKEYKNYKIIKNLIPCFEEFLKKDRN